MAPLTLYFQYKRLIATIISVNKKLLFLLNFLWWATSYTHLGPLGLGLWKLFTEEEYKSTSSSSYLLIPKRSKDHSTLNLPLPYHSLTPNKTPAPIVYSLSIGGKRLQV